jgi:hypothetical protein
MQQLIDPPGVIEAAVRLELDPGHVAELQLATELRSEIPGGTVQRRHECIGRSAGERYDESCRVAQIGADTYFRHGHLDTVQLGIPKAAAAEDSHERMTQLLANAQLSLAWRPT